MTVDELPRVSALICFPAEIMPFSTKGPHELHVTVAYIPDASSWPGQHILDSIRNVPNSLFFVLNRYMLANVIDTAAFGLDKNVPALRVEAPNLLLKDTHLEILQGLRYGGIVWDTTYAGQSYSPHMTVPLEIALKPPHQVLLKPMELWYMDDEPVVI